MRDLAPRLLGALALLLVSAASLRAPAAEPDGQAVPRAIDAELKELLHFVGRNRADPEGFDARRFHETLDFIAGGAVPNHAYHAAERDGAASAFAQVDLRRPLKDVLRLLFSADLPAAVMAPSTIRTASLSGFPSISWQRSVDDLEKLQRPFVAHAREHIVNSPDTHTGLYYEYNLDRTLILTRYRGRGLLISLSAQEAPSEAGRVGLIIGEDDDWTYLYTGRTGISWAGLGWIDTYMYDSRSVAFYVEGDRALTRFAVFKWVRAGWAGVNFVRSEHIHDGLERYTRALKLILEHPVSADPSSFRAHFGAMRSLPRMRLSELAGGFLGRLQQSLAHRAETQSEKEALTLLQDHRYLGELQHEELQAIVGVEMLKSLMGRRGLALVAPSADPPRGLAR